MSLSKEEIVPGVVAFLNPYRLYKDHRVNAIGGKTEFRPGPFLCVHVKDEMSIWLSLTHQRGHRGRHFKLQRRWRIGGNGRWQQLDSYIYSVRTPFVGLADAFVEAAQEEWPIHPSQRAYLSDEGLVAVEEKMREVGVDSLWKRVQEGHHFGLKKPLGFAVAFAAQNNSVKDDGAIWAQGKPDK